MSSVLQLLLEGERLDTAQMAQVLGLPESEIDAELTRLKAEEILLGWRPVLNPERTREGIVRAVIEVKISPERDGGFDRLASRIAGFDAVESCYLMSGAYDLLVFAVGNDLREVATFVSERLASVEGVLSQLLISCFVLTKSRGTYSFRRLMAKTNPQSVPNGDNGQHFVADHVAGLPRSVFAISLRLSRLCRRQFRWVSVSPTSLRLGTSARLLFSLLKRVRPVTPIILD